jgi:hypothetical protein
MNPEHQKLLDESVQYQNMINMNIPFTTMQNINNESNIIKDANNSKDEKLINESEEGKKNKRRSKNETQGRTFICKLCEKSYLSYPALYTHCKQKHNTSNTSGRGRGRPKKDNGDNQERLKYNPLDASYFLKENRKGTTNYDDFEKSIKDAFNELYSHENNDRNKSKEMKIYSNIEEHPFLGKFLLDKHDVNIKIDDEKEVSDIVFMDYLNKMSLHVNPIYFTKLIVFVTLFREYVNIIEFKKKNKDLNNDNNDLFKNESIEYTSTNSAEDVPDLSNEFINDFLDTDKNLFGFNKEDSIDLTQNFCHWMYENNFTSSKLTLISNDNK